MIEAIAHCTHLSGERPDRLHQALVSEIAHYLLPIFDRVEIVQRRVIKGQEFIVFPIGSDGVDELIQIQITQKSRRFGSLAASVVVWSFKKDAGKSHGYSANLPHAANSIPSILSFGNRSADDMTPRQESLVRSHHLSGL